MNNTPKSSMLFVRIYVFNVILCCMYIKSISLFIKADKLFFFFFAVNNVNITTGLNKEMWMGLLTAPADAS